jgi:hypothetical protein
VVGPAPGPWQELLGHPEAKDYCSDVQYWRRIDRGLTVLRALYALAREPFDDEIAGAVARFGRAWAAAAATRDRRALDELSEQIHEWIQRQAQPLVARMLVPFAPRRQRKPWEG